MTSLIIDVRDHIGGNCYDYVEEHGIRASKYGAHLFHTKFERVWDYVTQFSKWMPFDHRVKGMVPDKDGVKRLVPIPPVQETVNTLFGEAIDSEEKMQAWYEKERVVPEGGEPANGEEVCAPHTSFRPTATSCARSGRDARARARTRAEMDSAAATAPRACGRS